MTYEPSTLRDGLVIGALLLATFAAGWCCCAAWHSRKPQPPTPMQRALYLQDRKREMCERRNTVSSLYNQVFLSGINVGRSANLN